MSSFRIARISGIDIYVHVTFLLFVGLLALVFGWGGGVGAVLDFSAFLLAVFGSILLHELGHALAAREFGIKTRDITLYPIGGVARLERMPEKPMHEFWVAIAGPAVNLVIAGVLFAILWITGGVVVPAAVQDVSSVPFLQRLLAVNLMLLLFNLIPAFPMDGGRVLRALLATRMDHARATGVAAALGQLIALIFIVWGLLGGGVILMFIGFFIFLGAAQETTHAQMKEAFGGTLVEDAMVREYRTLSPGDTLADACQQIIDGTQTDFPVAWNDQIMGILTRSALIAGLANHGKDVPVSEVMVRDFQTVEAGEMLDTVFARMQSGPNTMLPVLRNGRLVGLLTTENLGELFMIRRALQGHAARKPPVS